MRARAASSPPRFPSRWRPGSSLSAATASTLLSVRLLRVNYLAEQSAAIKLSYAESDARKAYALVDGCRGHLDAALLLLDHVGRLPDVQGMINAERLAAVADLEAAIVAVQRSAEMATAARQDVSGAS